MRYCDPGGEQAINKSTRAAIVEVKSYNLSCKGCGTRFEHINKSTKYCEKCSQHK